MGRYMAHDQTTESATAFVSRCLASGDSRGDIAESLQTFYGVSRATAYRMIARQLIGTGDTGSPDIARNEDGGIDLATEAARQYAAAVSADDSKAALRWFHVLQRLAA
jgi:hypothetical protein